MKVVALAALLGCCVAVADTVKVPLGLQGEATLETPTRGLSMSQVIKQFGAPQAQRGPVGKPAINIWRYDGFNVYFERDRVIHAVLDAKPTDSSES